MNFSSKNLKKFSRVCFYIILLFFLVVIGIKIINYYFKILPDFENDDLENTQFLLDINKNEFLVGETIEISLLLRSFSKRVRIYDDVTKSCKIIFRYKLKDGVDFELLKNKKVKQFPFCDILKSKSKINDEVRILHLTKETSFFKTIYGKIKLLHGAYVIKFENTGYGFIIDPEILSYCKFIDISADWLPVNPHFTDSLEYYTNHVHINSINLENALIIKKPIKDNVN